MKDVIKVKTFPESYQIQNLEETIRAVPRLERKKNQIDTLDPLIGESQCSFKRKGFNHLMVHVHVHVFEIMVPNTGQEFKQIEMFLFHCLNI